MNKIKIYIDSEGNGRISVNEAPPIFVEKLTLTTESGKKCHVEFVARSTEVSVVADTVMEPVEKKHVVEAKHTPVKEEGHAPAQKKP